jgi:hypothetical protein
VKRGLHLAGWFGMALVLGAFFFVTFQILPTSSVLYKLLNLIGAILIAFAAKTANDYPSLALNLIWAILAMISFLRLP